MINVAEILSAEPNQEVINSEISNHSHALFLELKDARSEARQQERDSMFDTESIKDLRNWRKIIELAPAYLKEHAKDLTVASWLTEALTRVSAFPGLLAGGELIEGLLINYWDSLYPLPDEDGVITKLMPLIGLSGNQNEGALITPIYSLSLTCEPAMPIATWQYQQALKNAKITDEDRLKKLASTGVLSLDEIRQAVVSNTHTQYNNTAEQINACLEVFRRVSQAITDLCGPDIPTLFGIEKALQSCLEVVKTFAKMVAPAATVAQNTPDLIKSDVDNGDTRPSFNNQHVTSKAQAVQLIQQLADFYKQTEPYSPVAYLLEQAIRWNELALPEWLAEVIPNPEFLAHIYKLIGVQAPNSNESNMGNMGRFASMSEDFEHNENENY